MCFMMFYVVVMVFGTLRFRRTHAWIHKGLLVDACVSAPESWTGPHAPHRASTGTSLFGTTQRFTEEI